MDFRTGLGYDIHRLVEGRKLLLASVVVESPFGEDAHSDGDIVYHALANALLSSVGLEDIGYYFPDNLKKTENMDSSVLVHCALEEIQKRGYQVNNAVIDIQLEKPKLLPYRKQIKKAVADILSLKEEDVAIHANTGEKVGPVGESKAIVVLANVSIRKE